MHSQKQLINCDKCRDTGWIVTENNIYRKCECVDKEKIEKMWKRSGISLNDMNKTFKEFNDWNAEVTAMKDLTIQYFKSFLEIKDLKQNSLMLCGNPGCGKTHLLLALSRNLIVRNNMKVVYMPYRDEITAIKQMMIDADKYAKTLNKFKEADVLFIDDAFKGKITESDINIMFEIVNHRYLNNMPMIISTEFNTDKLLDIDEGLGSRIIEMCKGNMKEIVGRQNNYRLR